MSRVDYVGGAGAAIEDALLALVASASSSIVLQMYLFAENGHLVDLAVRPGAPPRARRFADALIARARDLPVVVILDTNTPDDAGRVRVPGTLIRERLRAAGVAVLNANLFATRFDADRRWPPAAGFHRTWQGVSAEAWVARQRRWQLWHTVEDHRKNLVVDGGRRAAVTSHNLIDAAADWHENALIVDGGAARGVASLAAAALADALRIPQRLDASGKRTVERAGADLAGAAGAATERSVRVLDTLAIRPALDEAIAASGAGDAIAVASTYFSDVPLVTALHAAAVRGAEVRVLFDDLGGLPMSGATAVAVRALANRRLVEAAWRLVHPRFAVRVHRSGDGRVMHLKSAAFTGGRRRLIAGQANATPNSFSGAWLETDLQVDAAPAVDAFLAHFDDLWSASAPLPPPARYEGVRSLACRSALAALAAFGLVP